MEKIVRLASTKICYHVTLKSIDGQGIIFCWQLVLKIEYLLIPFTRKL
jgi:hypothetical protein